MYVRIYLQISTPPYLYIYISLCLYISINVTPKAYTKVHPIERVLLL